MSATQKNQTLYAYYEDFSAFQVPQGIDLRDTKNICWYVRWNTLHIETKDGKKYEIEAIDNPQLKRPEKCVLHDDYSEDEIEFNGDFDDSSDYQEETSEEEEETSE